MRSTRSGASPLARCSSAVIRMADGRRACYWLLDPAWSMRSSCSPTRSTRPAAPTRPVQNALYDFGGGFPDPASFPYDGLVEATARMMKVEGAEALTYGD